MNGLTPHLSEASGGKLLASLALAQEQVASALFAVRELLPVVPDDQRPNARETADTLHAAGMEIRDCYRTMLQAGYRADGLPTALPVPLSQLDTPDTRELLSLITQALTVAERVDRDRGRALPADVPLLSGESRGTDLAESLSSLVRRLDAEVNPPKGRGE